METDDGNFKMRALTLLTTGLSSAEIEKESRDESPRASLYERTIDTDMMNEEFLLKAPWWRRLLYKYIPAIPSQVIEAYFLRKNYDIVISWSDPHTLLFASLLKLTQSQVPNIALMFWISKPKKAAVLKRVHSKIDRIILWTSTHREFAINVLGIPTSKIKFIPYYVDQKFWRPISRETDMICSVGVEMRDYPTLIKALKGHDIKCHIAAGTARGKKFSTVEAIYQNGPLPTNITVGKMNPAELRNLYSRSRFVVIPLLQSESDNGLTSILEAMAMGKAVICSRTTGQVDVIRDGITGIYVEQGNPEDLRKAIEYLWNKPEIADRMGAEGRKQIELNNTWDQFVNSVKSIAEEVVKEKRIQNQAQYDNFKSVRTHEASISTPS